MDTGFKLCLTNIMVPWFPSPAVVMEMDWGTGWHFSPRDTRVHRVPLPSRSDSKGRIASREPGLVLSPAQLADQRDWDEHLNSGVQMLIQNIRCVLKSTWIYRMWVDCSQHMHTHSLSKMTNLLPATRSPPFTHTLSPKDWFYLLSTEYCWDFLDVKMKRRILSFVCDVTWIIMHLESNSEKLEIT